MARRITLADVAAQAGASKATVSLVLNNKKSRISEETAERIRQAASELDYSPNQAAQTLRTGKTQTLAFISDEVLTTRFASAMIHGILEVAEDHEQMILMSETEHDDSRRDKAIESMQNRQVDGYIFGQMRARSIPILPMPTGLPAVVVNGRSQGTPSILPDEYNAGREAVQYLLKLGHRRIALIGRPREGQEKDSTINIPRRMQGIDDALAEAELALTNEFQEVYWEKPTGERGVQKILAETPDVTAFIAGNDRVAFGIYQTLQDQGYKVPDDFSVISFDDEELASYLSPGLTTMRLPYAEMGQAATQILLQEDPKNLIPGVRSEGNEVLIPMPLIERESVKDLRP